MIQARGLTKRFGGTLAVDDPSFVVEPGKVTGLLGPNGAGKSTTLHLMLGLVRGGGRTLFDGRPYQQLACPMRVVGAMLEARALHPRRSARDHLRMLAAASLLSATAALAASTASVALLLALSTWDGSLLADPRLWRSIALGTVTAGLVAALAVGLAALTRGSGLPVVMIVLWGGVVEPLTVIGLGGGVARVLPFLSLLQLTAYTPDSQDLGSQGPLAWAVFPLYLAAVLTTAAIALARRDAATS